MKKLLVFFLFILLLLFLINNSPLMSVVTIKNGTNKIVYVFSGESIYGVEPEPDEVDRIKRKVPEVVGPGETIKITTSLSSMIKDDVVIYIGWRRGGRYEYNAVGGGGRNFLLSSDEGLCSVLIVIQEGYHKDSLEYEGGDICLTGMKPFQYKY